MKKLLSDFKIDKYLNKVRVTNYSYEESANTLLEIKKLRLRISWLEREVYSTQVEFYIKSIMILFNLPKMGIGLLFELLKRSDKYREIHLDTKIKKEILEIVQLEEKTYNNVIGKLLNEGLITRLKNHSYKTNPNIFGKRGWRDLQNRKNLWIKIDFDSKTGLPEVSTCFTKKYKKKQ